MCVCACVLVGPNQQADRAWGDYLQPTFVCSEFLNSIAGTVLVQS